MWRAKPVLVDCLRLTPKTPTEAMNAAEWLGFTLGAVLVGESGNQYVFYKGETQLNVDHGDWIIKYEDGSIAVCGDERFHVYYERIVN